MHRPEENGSTERTEMTRDPESRRDPPARRICTQPGRLSKTKTGQFSSDGDEYINSDDYCAWWTGSFESCAHPGPALRAAAAEGGCTGFSTDRQAAGLTATGLRRGGYTELLDHVEAAAVRASCGVAGAADQDLKGVCTRLAVIFVNWHKSINSSSSATRPGVSHLSPWIVWGASGGKRAPGLRSAQGKFRAARFRSGSHRPPGILGHQPSIVNGGRMGLTRGESTS
jgi:hypothetical protein